ncbi:MAG: NAD-dependent epimerase/dehydratase family protein [Verrucomicrobiales bacterium]
MKVIITGGGGFLGFQLCKKLQQIGTLIGPSGEPEPIDEIVLFDAFFSETIQQGLIDEPTLLTRDITDRDAVFDAIDGESISVFHLASMVSGECELDFDKAMSVNLDGGRHVFEATRTRGPKSRLVFASSIACFGGEAMPDTLTDFTKPWPQTTYGMTKSICEQLVNDHSRKGHFDGRSARLPTVIIRPGKPNAAASSWASGMFREPLGGEPCYLPVHRDQRHPMTGYRTVINSLVALHDLDGKLLGNDRAVGLPAHTVTPNEAEFVVRQVGEERDFLPGLLVDEPDDRIQGIVNQWPTAVDGSRAVKLGLPEPPDLKQIVCEYLEDFG